MLNRVHALFQLCPLPFMSKPNMPAHNQPVRTNQGGLLLEADLLGPEPSEGLSMLHDHAVVTAPVLTGDALQALGVEVFPQTALYGRVLSQHGNDLDPKTLDPRVFVNTNAPFSALVCGVQVYFQSHATSFSKTNIV
jgi:hypothetical protein